MFMLVAKKLALPLVSFASGVGCGVAVMFNDWVLTTALMTIYLIILSVFVINKVELNKVGAKH